MGPDGRMVRAISHGIAQAVCGPCEKTRETGLFDGVRLSLRSSVGRIVSTECKMMRAVPRSS